MIRNPKDIKETKKKIRMLIAGYPGIGKALTNETPVLTDTGFLPIGEISAGDKVFGEDGQLHNVVGVFRQGVRPTYNVTFNDGIVIQCDEDHIWTVCAHGGNSQKLGWRDMTTKELLKHGIVCDSPSRKKSNRQPHLRWMVPIGKAAEFDRREDFVIPPYLMGVLLGDGCTSSGHPSFCTPECDEAIVERVRNVLPDGYSLTMHVIGIPHYYIKYEGRTNPIKRAVHEYGIDAGAKEKHIPLAYMTGSVEQRLDLLRGMMDTDGSAKNNRVTYCTTSEQLADDVVSLVRSLGGFAQKHGYDRAGEGKPLEYHVRIRLNYCPFSLKRKVEQWQPTIYNRLIKSIEPAGDAECTCIMVDNPTGLFVTKDYAITHNSTLALSAPKPLHIDVDFGIDRIEPRYRVPYIQPADYDEILGDLKPENLGDFETLVFDTGGKLISLMSLWAIKKEPKNSKRDGSLSLQGYGAVGREFNRLMDYCFYELKKNIVIVFHATEEKDGDNTRLRIKVEGQTKNNVWEPMDLGGFVEMYGEKRMIGFSNCERYFAKGTRGIHGMIEIPTLTENSSNDFLTRLFELYNASSKKEAEEAEKKESAYNAAMEKGREIVDGVTDADSANAAMKMFKKIQHSLTSERELTRVWNEKMKALGLTFDKAQKKYVGGGNEVNNTQPA